MLVENNVMRTIDSWVGFILILKFFHDFLETGLNKTKFK